MNRVVTGYHDNGEPAVIRQGVQGAHATGTLDYVTVLSGEVTLAR
jgi:hypothetical protein